MVTKKTFHPGQGNLFPDQLELFAGMVNRQNLPLDVVPSSSTAPVSPAINQVLQSVANGLGKLVP